MDREKIIEQILFYEWKMMISITAIDDPEGCREKPLTFKIMRESQHLVWSDDTLSSYLADLELAESKRVNMVAERYAHMMRVTNPLEYEQVKRDLRPLSKEAIRLVETIMGIFSEWNRDVDKRYPNIRSLGRPTSEDEQWTSVDTYLKGELLTYSVKTLSLCLQDIYRARAQSVNMSEMMLFNMARFYGYQSLDDMEKRISSSA